ncbi:hypothetical protein CAPTEDRAFT_191166 [Capitella teleta]|uniref:Uncharacterized protein n=1 Tax=Capitella teleta TaxID=283909 RepID=R7UHZ2_CAPTE|nr:hypothetical protein CAPTEDRAFT_191166 [Capitella teleta]|eukprot:ELU02887.1 hypothetical protein CAPTEDRAFT_191166 [Capitella teleta]
MASANTSYQGTNFNAMRIDLPLVPLTHPLQREAQKIPMGSRNLTGVFLGVEGTASAKCSKNSSKGQARVRGMPSSRSRTPTERKRYEKVEQLRVKEEKRGFSGQLLKKRSPRGIDRSPRCSHNVSRSDIHEVIRQTHRQFTAATNSGFSRLECLQMNSGGGAYEDAAWRESIDADISQQIHRLTLHRREGQLAGNRAPWGNLATTRTYPLTASQSKSLTSGDNVDPTRALRDRGTVQSTQEKE